MDHGAIRQPIDEHRQKQSPKLEKYFRGMTKANASDLHLKPLSPPHVRIRSEISPSPAPPLSAEEIEQMVAELLTETQLQYFHEHGSIDIAHEIDGGDRFRVNVYRQRSGLSLAVRRVKREIPDFEQLYLPPVLRKVAEEHQGLVLLSGPTGCGKSTTIASMLQYINRTRRCHILTIEDPIEYLYQDDKAFISQREVGIDVESFEAALKYLPREDPDVVLIGELRDFETFQAALRVSETGHMVFGTVHAANASQTVERIVNLFPADTRHVVRQSLAFNLQAVICQKLLPSIAQGVDRIPAVEILMANPSVQQLIVEGRDAELPEIIRSNERDGMQSFTRSLLELIQKDLIDPHVAYEVAPNVDELKMMLKGISASRSGLLGR